MKIVIAPDSFKESLAAEDVAAALAQGVLEVCPDARIDLCPMADGGSGTVAAMVSATGGQMMSADVYGPLGQPVRAHFGLLGVPSGAGLPGAIGLAASPGETPTDGDLTAVIEMAAASGLAIVPVDRRDPMRATTFGTGQLIMAALDAGVKKIIIGLGGSATVDGGAGCAQALGVTFIDRKGQACICGLGGGGLINIDRIDMAGMDERLGRVSIRVACDVNNPLTGSDGAAAVYGPQKGATPDMVALLNAGLAHFAAVIRRELDIEVESVRGAGAAGGLAAGLMAFAGARLEPGLDMIADAVGLQHRLNGADLCITGEGRLDRSSAFGKTAVGVSKLAAKSNVPVVCVPGQASADAPQECFVGVHPLVAGEVTVQAAMRHTQNLLKIRAAEAVRSFLRK